MQNAMVVENRALVAAPAVPAAHSTHQIPLTFMRAGERANVMKVRGKDEVHHHLENLGFVAGAPVHVVAEQSGSIIVEVKGSQVALDKSAASKIVVA